MPTKVGCTNNSERYIENHCVNHYSLILLVEDNTQCLKKHTQL